MRKGVLYTPPLSAPSLEGITPDTVIPLARGMGPPVSETRLTRDQLCLADEAFFTGTAAEVTPIREIDDHVGGPPGPVTFAIQQAYLDTVHGRTERWGQWLEYAPTRAEA